MTKKIVSIITPCRNECNHISSFVNGVLTQIVNGWTIELIIADGMSDDGTCLVLNSLCQKFNMVRWIKNPGRIVSTGLNLAISLATGEIIVRMDVHTQYAEDYVQKCIDTLASTGAMCVGGPWVAVGHTPCQHAIAAAFQSRIGSGGAPSRQVNYSGWVDTVYLGAWMQSDLVRLGGFDELLVRNQDDELSLRIHRIGGKVWQSSQIRSVYIPRSSLINLFNQYRQYGYWKIPVIRKHRLPASPRHLAPFIFFAGLTSLLLTSFVWTPALFIFLISSISYIFLLLIGTYNSRLASITSKVTWLTVFAVATIHLGYAAGFTHAIWDFWIRRKSPHHTMTKLTR